MRWNYLETSEGCGWVPCTVCGRNFPDSGLRNGAFMYFPRLEPGCEGDADRIEKLWGVDPYSDFAVCEGCVAGHCGAVPGLTSDRWLGNWTAEHELGRPVTIRHDSPGYEDETRWVHGLRPRSTAATQG
jgi:hypothetical protein